MPEGLEALGAWRQAHEFMLFVHREVVPCLPPEEKWDLAAQIRRSSKSIAANIAEGYGRFYYQDIGWLKKCRQGANEPGANTLTLSNVDPSPIDESTN